MSDLASNPPIPLSDVDRYQLTLKDEAFHLHTWEDLKEIIANNRLEDLKRKPSDLRRYVAWLADIKSRYGSITNYLCQERLRWTPLDSPSTDPRFSYKDPTPFANPADYKIALNDWPYGFEPSITHICVWLKTPIPIDDSTGDLTPESRELVDDFVTRTFVERLDSENRTSGENGRLVAEVDGEAGSGLINNSQGNGDDVGDSRLQRGSREMENRGDEVKHGGGRDRVLWFKNWVSLQSVRAIDHVHVLVRDVPGRIVDDWTS